MFKGILVGIVLALLGGILGTYLFIANGCFPANADSKPPELEKWMARTSLHATFKREVVETPNPMPFNDDNLIAGIKLYAVNCAVCHGASDGMSSNIAKGLYQFAPQLGRHGVEDDPEARTFWVVKHGIRLTGMPAFSKTLDDNAIWQLTLFLKHMDALTPAAEKAWRTVPSSAS